MVAAYQHGGNIGGISERGDWQQRSVSKRNNGGVAMKSSAAGSSAK